MSTNKGEKDDEKKSGSSGSIFRSGSSKDLDIEMLKRGGDELEGKGNKWFNLFLVCTLYNPYYADHAYIGSFPVHAIIIII